MYECPRCHKDINKIGVVCECTQLFDLTTAEYGEVESIEKTLEYYCPECGDTLPFNEVDELILEIEEYQYDQETGC